MKEFKEKVVSGKKVREYSDGNVTVGVSVSDFPLSQFSKWEKDCNRNYGGCYWMKMVSDHEQARAYAQLMKLLEEAKPVEAKEEEDEGELLLSGEKV